MNRRTFLKLAAIATVGVPALANTEKEIRWIPLTERVPQPGQKIIFTNSFTGGFEGGVITDPGYKPKEDDEFNITIAMTKMDFVQCYKNRHKKSVINFVYSNEGEEVLRSRNWLKSEVKIEYSYHKPEPGFLNNTCARYLRKEMVWLPVNGEYPIEIPPLPKAKRWTAFKDQMPKNGENIEIRDKQSETRKGEFISTLYVRRNASGDPVEYVPEKNNTLLKLGPCYYMEVDKLKWSWRYA